MTAARLAPLAPLAPIVVEDVLELVGGTPLVRIRLLDREVPGGRAEVWAKMEEANPAGSVIEEEDLERIVRVAHERGIYLILDECYVYLNFTGDPVSGATCT